MTNNTVSYPSDYFKSWFFETDYQTIAAIIVEIYQPKTLVEFGCGPGHLSRELAKLGVQVTAVDGFSQPDFAELPVEFHSLNLNDPDAIANLFTGKSFDLALSLEVAEHLEPEISPTIANWLTKVAPVVVFSAGVPGQEAHGHINLQPRDYWHKLFTQANFLVADRIRERLRIQPSVAHWYRLNVMDYVHIDHSQIPQPDEVIQRLIASESAATTAYFEQRSKLYALQEKGLITDLD
ncbi:class I SAM-dependent methyltransferase [Nodularia sphaerocarpa]|uniref:class I SAM-dependent methyltransferase n=1 Tax=Nodularia sphaerocarpa TaxID=137816 RepID=UPI001EFA4060|nr:methyltransferase domain-containing protein [Nodularia sphaerocarpa]MDB9376043.1 methyltransferase domain-containing protein [Nodularia sphaerocarpa CS-585]MDB9380130.1 methyltransferase domain-containing protein [Nodularia sphaerocarpa CS-585A2]ULP72084.1 Ubiquinone biosynthesis O-methyltransferase [Nodularia sphaerocarpa UHCC 0038]